jgi:hypothetical protein
MIEELANLTPWRAYLFVGFFFAGVLTEIAADDGVVPLIGWTGAAMLMVIFWPIVCLAAFWRWRRRRAKR